jgi:hypothetical protein
MIKLEIKHPAGEDGGIIDKLKESPALTVVYAAAGFKVQPVELVVTLNCYTQFATKT